MFLHSQCAPECKSLAWLTCSDVWLVQVSSSGVRLSLFSRMNYRLEYSAKALPPQSRPKSNATLTSEHIFSASWEMWNPGPPTGEISNNIMILEQFSVRQPPSEGDIFMMKWSGFLPAPLVSNCLMRNNTTCCWVSSGLDTKNKLAALNMRGTIGSQSAELSRPPLFNHNLLGLIVRNTRTNSPGLSSRWWFNSKTFRPFISFRNGSLPPGGSSGEFLFLHQPPFTWVPARLGHSRQYWQCDDFLLYFKYLFSYLYFYRYFRTWSYWFTFTTTKLIPKLDYDQNKNINK